MRARCWLAVLAVTLLLTGCWDAVSPEQLAWVSAIGVDRAPANNFLFTFQLIVPRAATGQAMGTGAGPSGSGSATFSVAAPDVVTALAFSDSFEGRRINLQHAKALIIGEDVARAGIGRFIAPALRYQEFRRTMNVLVARGSAQQFLRLLRPKLESNPAFWFEMMATFQAETQLVPPARIHDFAVAAERPGAGARAILVAPRPDLISQGGARDHVEAEGDAQAGSPAETVAGNILRVGEVPVEWLGTAVFKGDRLTGNLTGLDTRWVALLRGELKRRTTGTVPDPLNPGRRVVFLVQGQSPPRVRVTRTGTRVFADFFVPVEGDIVSVPSETDYTAPATMHKLEQAAEKFYAQQLEAVLRKTLNEWGTDLYDIGERIRPSFATLTEFEAFRWGERVRQTTFRVQVKFNVRRHGQQVEPATPRR